MLVKGINERHERDDEEEDDYKTEFVEIAFFEKAVAFKVQTVGEDADDYLGAIYNKGYVFDGVKSLGFFIRVLIRSEDDSTGVNDHGN